MAASSNAVAPICASAAVTVQAKAVEPMTGSGSPVTASTIARNTRPKGRPNRKRTCVAPTVPSVAVSSFCCALRNTWPAAATTVKTAHNHGIAFAPNQPAYSSWRPHSRLFMRGADTR